MAISKDLFLAILAMDSYNRGYGAGLADERVDDPDGLDLGDRVGSATSKTFDQTGIDQTDYDVWQSDDFYAIAYDIGSDGPEGMAA